MCVCVCVCWCVEEQRRELRPREKLVDALLLSACVLSCGVGVCVGRVEKRTYEIGVSVCVFVPVKEWQLVAK